MAKRKSGGDKIIGIAIGAALVLSIAGAINLVSAHGGNNNVFGGMHMMMGGTTGDMMGDLTVEGQAEMLKIMDKDTDGICDHCGVSTEACEDMMISL